MDFGASNLWFTSSAVPLVGSLFNSITTLIRQGIVGFSFTLRESTLSSSSNSSSISNSSSKNSSSCIDRGWIYRCWAWWWGWRKCFHLIPPRWKKNRGRKKRKRIEQAKKWRSLTEAGWRMPWNKPWLNLPLLRQQELIQLSQICKARNLLTSSTKAPISPSTRKKNGFPKKETNLKADRQAIERDHSSLRRALLRPLFNLTSVDGKELYRSTWGYNFNTELRRQFESLGLQFYR